MRTETENGRTVIYLEGRIDTANAPEIEREINSVLDEAAGEPVLDGSGLEYISSAGLRVLMKLRRRVGSPIEIRGLTPEVYEVFEMTGFTELFTVSKRIRELSVDGCKLIGQGFYGSVYRIDDETIVKVFRVPDSRAVIEEEKRKARIALVNGLPTAISYDIVRVGDSLGAVFELLNARSFNDLIIEQPENIDSILEQYAGFLRLIHDTEIVSGDLPAAKDVYIGYADKLADLLGSELSERIKALLRALPDDPYAVHGDYQMKNVMLVNGEPMLIDMDTLSVGDRIFDLAALFVTYRAYGEDEPENSMNFLGISSDKAEYIFTRLLELYFGTEDRQRLADLTDRISVAGYLRFLYLVTSSEPETTTLGRLRREHSVQKLKALAERVNDLRLGL